MREGVREEGEGNERKREGGTSGKLPTLHHGSLTNSRSRAGNPGNEAILSLSCVFLTKFFSILYNSCYFQYLVFDLD